MEKFLKKFKFVKDLMAENEDLRRKNEVARLISESNDKLQADLAAEVEKKESEKEHYKCIAAAILSKNHLCMSKKNGTYLITLERNELDECKNKVIHEDSNFPMTSITVYAE